MFNVRVSRLSRQRLFRHTGCLDNMGLNSGSPVGYLTPDMFSSERFWLSCGLYPQILDISFTGVSSITEIGIQSVNGMGHNKGNLSH